MNRPLLKQILTAVTVAAASYAAGLSLARLTYAALPPSPPKYDIPAAAALYVTERGQQIFAHNELLQLLEQNQIDLSKGALDRWSYRASGDLKLRRLPKDAYDKLQELRALLTEWLGFELKDPRLNAVVRGASYELEGLALSVRVDRELTARLRPGQDGVVVVTELSIPRFKAQARSICLHDSNNPIFGACDPVENKPELHRNGIGVYRPWIGLRDDQPLRLSIPARVGVGAQGALEVEVIGAKTNLKDLEFATGRDRKLLLPKITIEAGDRKMTLNAAEINDAFARKEREFVKIGLYHLNNFLEEELPPRLNALLAEPLKRSFETVKHLGAPGTTVLGNQMFPLAWGLRPARLGLSGDLLRFELDGFLSDPWKSASFRPAPRIRDLPDLSGMKRSAFDAAFAIDLDVINGMIELSRKRGNLETISAGQVRGIKLIQAPALKADSSRNGRIRAVLELKNDGFWDGVADLATGSAGAFKRWYALSPERFQVELDLIVSIKAEGPHAFKLVVDRIDPETARIQDRYIDHAADEVRSTLSKMIEELNAGYERSPMALNDRPIELPREALGLPLKLLHGDFDPSNHLVLYFEYGGNRERAR
jgi:hypothetical protein